VRIQVQAVKVMTRAFPKSILLVGGFGENDYLKEELELSFPEIKVQQLNRAISAISRGAVARGISDRAVLNHISRYNYGIIYAESYVEGKHPVKHKTQDKDYPGTYQVFLMEWYLNKGQSITNKKPVTFEFSKCFYCRDDLETCVIKVHYSASEKREKYQTNGVKFLCEIHAKFDKNLWDPLPFEDHEDQMKRLIFSVTMKITAGSLNWSVACEGQTCGEQRVNVEYE
jgi:hypothetical protein